MSCGHRRYQSEFEEIIYPKNSLVKYESPRLIVHDDEKSKKNPQTTTSFHSQLALLYDQYLNPLDFNSNSCSSTNILDILFPPIEFVNKTNHKYISCVSRQAATVYDIRNLENQLNHRLRTSHALEVGLCHSRRQIYDQCFDELLRQITIECTERGILLYRIRNTYRQMMYSYSRNSISANAYAMRVILLNEEYKLKLNHQINQLENEIEELNKQKNHVEDDYENILKLYSRFQLTNQSQNPTMIPFELQQLRTIHKGLRQDLESILNKKLDFQIFEQIKKKKDDKH